MSALVDERFRSAIWRMHRATEEEARELVEYAASPLHGDVVRPRYPLPEPPCVAAWERYAGEARGCGVDHVLRRVLAQLRFPVAAGMSASAEYQAATRRGLMPPEDRPGLGLVSPEGLRVFLHPTPAGRVPVVRAEAREDFEALVRAVTMRNEPGPVPATMGACMIAGYNNWDRVREWRRAREARDPMVATEAGWAAAFSELVPQKEAYQDRFMLLSSGPYSSTPAAAVGATEPAWREASVRIRLEHECTHYFMRQAFGCMRKSMLDELVADYMGLVEAFGSFRLDGFLLFMGLESHPPYRQGGRLENYRGPLSDGAFLVLQTVVKRAAQNLARLDPARGNPLRSTVAEKARLVTALTSVGLEGLAAGDADRLLARALGEAGAEVTAPEVAPPERVPAAARPPAAAG